jgi:metallo-beta-lactamase class B
MAGHEDEGFRLRASGFRPGSCRGAFGGAHGRSSRISARSGISPIKPFKVFGNTYWVGTRGLGSVLITSDRGHVLIDGALPESVPQIRDHVRELGFKLEDVRLLLNSHVALRPRRRARRTAAAHRRPRRRQCGGRESIRGGRIGRDDPQYGILPPIERLKNVEVVREGQFLKVGSLIVMAHMTPGHTPGGTSWSWRSCEGPRCLDFVYADSLTPVSADGYKYTGGPMVPAFEQAFTTLEKFPCDILLTPHPGASGMLEKLAARDGGKPDAFVVPAPARRTSPPRERTWPPASRRRAAVSVAPRARSS